MIVMPKVSPQGRRTNKVPAGRRMRAQKGTVQKARAGSRAKIQKKIKRKAGKR